MLQYFSWMLLGYRRDLERWRASGQSRFSVQNKNSGVSCSLVSDEPW
jgi:hypothetical protein